MRRTASAETFRFYAKTVRSGTKDRRYTCARPPRPLLFPVSNDTYATANRPRTATECNRFGLFGHAGC